VMGKTTIVAQRMVALSVLINFTNNKLCHY
jgi:hypothetical protein